MGGLARLEHRPVEVEHRTVLEVVRHTVAGHRAAVVEELHIVAVGIGLVEVHHIAAVEEVDILAVAGMGYEKVVRKAVVVGEDILDCIDLAAGILLAARILAEEQASRHSLVGVGVLVVGSLVEDIVRAEVADSLLLIVSILAWGQIGCGLRGGGAPYCGG